MSDIAKSTKKQVPVSERLFTWPSDVPCLIGTRCRKCGEVFFPTQIACSFCSSTDTEEITFSRRGILDYYTCTWYPTPGYSGPVPLCIGFVRLPEGTKIISPLAKCRIEELKIGMEMEMVVQPVATDDQGNDVMGFAFRPMGITK
jgi:uncharacterized protein